MAKTIYQIIKERRKDLLGLNNHMRTIDTIVEDIQRMITRIRGRKKKLPEVTDLERIYEQMGFLNREVDAIVDFMAKLAAGWDI